jgi:hypothetical protein
MKNKLVLTIILVLCFSVLVFTFSKTYSRFSSNGISISEINVAKWEVLINGKSINEEYKFNLFETINNNHVKDGVKVISPGSYGSATFNIVNNSNVVANYEVFFQESKNDGNIPILYSLEEDGDYKELEDIVFSSDNELDFNGTDSLTLYWKWDYYKDLNQNQLDKQLGDDGSSIVEITMGIKAEQAID